MITIKKICAADDCNNEIISTEEEQKKCFHYTNLQPLWIDDHRKKSAKENTNCTVQLV